MTGLATLTGRYARSLSPRTRAAVLAALVVAVLLACGLAYALRGDGSALFARPLDPDQLSEVQSRLTAWDIPFKATADNVFVAGERKRDVALRLATAGLPHPHLTTSDDTLKTINALTPESVLDAQVRQGLEGDLAQGLRGITGIVDARVIIAPATHGFFVDEPSHDASASVRVTLDQGATLAPDAIGGIRSYVASAVPGLSSERVALVDQNGVPLGAHAAGADSTEDKGLERTLQTALDRTVGPGETLVLAHVDTDQSTTTSHEVTHAPLFSKPVESQALREHYVGKNKSYDKVSENVDRGSDTVERNTRTDAGAIKHRSVAVFVDQRRAALVPRIEAVLAAAAGILPARGDTLVVQPIDFAKSPDAAAPVAARTNVPSLAMSLPLALLAIASVAALVLLGRPLATSLAGREPAERLALVEKQRAAAEFEPVRIHATLKGEPAHSAAAVLAALPAATTAAVLDLYDSHEREEIAKRLTRPVAPVVRDVRMQAGSV